MRSAPLTVVKGGIDRGRPKGGIRADVLFDLVNAQITEQFKIGPREGTTRVASLPAGTVGLVAFEELFHVFASVNVDLTLFPTFRLNILLHPFNPASAVSEIHFAEPFMGALYVVAEFSDGQIYHYWLQDGVPWTLNTEIAANEFRTPTVVNGYVYRATRKGSAFPAWTPGAVRAVGNIIEPTEYNEYYFQATATQGANPASGTTEPPWPTATGEKITESTDGITFPNNNDAQPPSAPAANTPQASTTERYEL